MDGIEHGVVGSVMAIPGTGGLPDRRLDQQRDYPPAGVQPGSSAGIVRARLVIVSGPSGAISGIFVYAAGTTPALGNPPIVSVTNGTSDPFGNPVVPGLDVTQGAITGTTITGGTISGTTISGTTFIGTDFVLGTPGFFLYLGTPALGNPPVLAASPPGITQDTFGNPVSAVMNIGNVSAAHIGWDDVGNTYISDATNSIRISLQPADALIGFWAAGGFPSAYPQIAIASQSGSLGGNTIPAGIGLESLPVLAYSTSPPALGNLMVSLSPVSGSDTFGNTFDQGIDVQSPGLVHVNGTSGQKIVLEIHSGSPILGWFTGVSEEGIAASAQSLINNAGASEVMTLAIFGAEGSVHNDRVAIGMNSAAKDNSSTANGTLSYTKAGGGAANVATWGIKGMKVFSSITGDGNTYQPERLTAGQLAPITINQQVFSQQIVQTLTPGVGKYKVNGQICYTPNQAAGAAQFSFGAGGGLTVSTMHIIFKEFATGNPSALDSVADLNSFAGVFTGAVFGVAERITEFCGTVTFSASGTMGLFAATTVAADTYAIEAEGSFIEMFPIGP
jgi:hypothetical protein